MVKRGAISKEIAEEYLARLASWKHAVDQRVDASICRLDPSAPVPPLGWTLDRDSAEVIKCLLRPNAGVMFTVPPLPRRTQEATAK